MCPTLDVVSSKRLHDELDCRIRNNIFSSDSVCVEEGNTRFELETFSPEKLNAINCFVLPPYKLDLKVGVFHLQWIDKFKGQALSWVGLYLSRYVFGWIWILPYYFCVVHLKRYHITVVLIFNYDLTLKIMKIILFSKE